MPADQPLAPERTAAPSDQWEVGPSPVLELCYAFFRTVAPEKPHSSATLPWLRQLEDERPGWFVDAREAFGGERWTGYEALLMACTLGYALDDDPSRFVADVPQLPARMVSILERGGARGKAPAVAAQTKTRTKLQANYEELARGRLSGKLSAALAGLWESLASDWQEEGEAAALRASEELLGRAREGGDLLSALPPHHFVSLETSLRDIRRSEEGVRIVVAPLYFAAMGGYNFEVGNAHYMGYGIRSGRLFKKRQHQTAELAGRLRAFSDPTRLLLLVLIGRLRRFPLTVGDLARQLGVSQPTASGHLRLLRELELVEVVKRGNRSYYRILKEPIRAALGELTELLLLDEEGAAGR